MTASYDKSIGLKGTSADELTTAVIYCRVSSKKQVSDGDGLGSQETSGRAYAQMRGYSVAEVFRDGITGSAQERPGFVDLLAFLDQWRLDGKGFLVVIVDDLKRLARDVAIHFDLKEEVVRRGGRLESPNFRFEDTPEGKFIETIIAAQAELERNQNRRQVIARMRSRMEQGYWAFKAPPGYTFRTDRVHTRILVPAKPEADWIRESLEGFASGRFPRAMDVERFLSKQGFFGPAPERGSVSVRLNRIHSILGTLVYTGYIEHEPWGITLRRGYHEPLISLETYHTIQDRLRTYAHKPSRPAALVRSDTNELFPLRGLILCAGCLRPLSGSVSRNRLKKRYPYYHCAFRACSMYGKVVPARRIHEEFEALLLRSVISETNLALLRSEALRWWGNRRQHLANSQRQNVKELNKIADEIRAWGDKIQLVTTATTLQVVEQRIADLSLRQLRLRAATQEYEANIPAVDARTLFAAVEPVLKNSIGIWKSGDLNMRRIMARIVFDSPATYERGKGFGTPDYALPYRISDYLSGHDCTMVDYPEQIPNIKLDKKAGDSSPPGLDFRRLWELFGEWSSAISACGGLA